MEPGTKRTQGVEGIVTLLDARWSRAVEGIWRRIDRELGLRGVLVTPYPHFSYLVGERLDLERLRGKAAELTRRTRPFPVRVRGVATFPDPWPVVFLSVIADRRLRDLHREVWEALGPAVRDPMEYYRPGRWVPHITLAHGEEPTHRPLTSDEVTGVKRLISRAPLEGTVLVDNLSTIVERKGRQELGPRFDFPVPSIPSARRAPGSRLAGRRIRRT